MHALADHQPYSNKPETFKNLARAIRLLNLLNNMSASILIMNKIGYQILSSHPSITYGVLVSLENICGKYHLSMQCLLENVFILLH